MKDIKEEFKILEEITLDYGSQKQLWLMLVKVDGYFGVEMNDRQSLVGHKIAQHRKEAEVMFEQIGLALRKLKTFRSALEHARLSFSFKTVREMMFVINTRHSTYDFNSLCKLKRVYRYTTFPRIEDMIWEDKNLNHTIEITFPGNKQPIGKFIGFTANEQTVFKLFLNADEPLQK